MSRLLAVVVLALVLTGCTGDTSAGPDAPASPAAPTRTTTAPTPRPPVPPAPAVGACRRLTLVQAVRPTNDSPRVPCRRRHTAYTLHVGRLDTEAAGRTLAVDGPRVQRQLARSCLPLLRAVGGTPEQRRLSRFQVVWFSPTRAEYDAGADWFRCDLVALGDADRLLPLPVGRRARGVLDRPGALTTYGLCGTAPPGARAFERVACGLRHRWVALSTIAIPGRRQFPGLAVVRRAGDEACADLVRRRNGFPLSFTYGWEWPTRAQWAAGQHYGFCWAPNDLA